MKTKKPYWVIELWNANHSKWVRSSSWPRRYRSLTAAEESLKTVRIFFPPHTYRAVKGKRMMRNHRRSDKWGREIFKGVASIRPTLSPCCDKSYREAIRATLRYIRNRNPGVGAKE